ncbi:MAG: HNH endonuclease signature motif containing protein [Acidobacteriota bacterium]
MANRPEIPATIKRRILLESGYRCSIPTCRFPITENAHIVSWSETKDHSYENLIALCPNCHTLYDSGRIDKKALIAYKKKLLFLNEVYSRFEIDVLDYLKSHKRALIFSELMVKRLLDEGLVSIEDQIMTQEFDDNEEILGIFSVVLTKRGERLIEDWSKVDDSLTFDNL